MSVAVLASLFPSAAAAAPGDLTLASTSATGEKGNFGTVGLLSISADGTRVAFESQSTNLHPEDTDNVQDIYVKDLVTGEVFLASSSDEGVKGNSASLEASLSADATKVAFQSHATNLDPADTDGLADIYVKDLVSGELTLASASGAGVKGDNASIFPDLSADGTTVAFSSFAQNLDPADGCVPDPGDLDDPDDDFLLCASDVFVKDLGTGDIVLASTSDSGERSNSDSVRPSLSADGTRVAFESQATNLDPADTDQSNDVYVKDLATGDLVLASAADDGTGGNNLSAIADLAENGSRVVFQSSATNLDPADAGFTEDIYVKDLGTGDVVLASTSSGGTKANALSQDATLSNDGTVVSFSSNATNLDPGDADGNADIYVKDLDTGELALASVTKTGTNANGHAFISDLAASGSKVAFAVTATNLDPADTDPFYADVYVKELAADAPPLAIENVPEAGDPVGRFQRFEASFDLNRMYANPFDPDEIAVDVTFTSPTGVEQTVPAFWFQDFEVQPGTENFEGYDPVGDPHWQVRFAPSEVGTYTYVITATEGSGEMAISPEMTFVADPSSEPGFVRVHSANPLYLQFDDGATYLPRGHNAAFEDGNPATNGTAYYGPLFQSFGTAGENWTRIWMTDFARNALEWSAGHFSGFYSGVGTYSLPSAWRIDAFLDLAAQHGLQVQLVLNDHGQFSDFVNARWSENPYNEANGGPVPPDRPDLFFSDPIARDLFKQRLRYTVARWGAYTDVLAWELFNEVQFIGTAALNPSNDAGVRAAVQAWHAELSAYLAGLDPFDHLITTSSDSSPLTDVIWDLPTINLVQVHDYSGPPTDRDQVIRDVVSDLKVAHHKPVIVGEFGIGSGDPERDFDPVAFGGSEADRDHLIQGTHLHNGVWTAALSESEAMSWWWGAYVAEDPARNRMPPDFPVNERVFPALDAYLAGEDFPSLGLTESSLTTTPDVLAFGLDNGEQAFVWVRDVMNEYGSGAGPGNLEGRVISGGEVTIDGMAPGPYEVDVYHTYRAGGVATTGLETAPGGSLTVSLPDFTRDIAFKVRSAVQPPVDDADGDGLLDEWEENGIDADGDGTIDLALHEAPFNADPQHKDVFVEIDYMDCAVGGCLAGDTHTHEPVAGALADVVGSFAAAPVGNPDGLQGVTLHAMLDEAVPEAEEKPFDSAPGGFDELKSGDPGDPCDGSFGTPAERASANCAATLAARKLAFHYAVFGHDWDSATHSSGVGEFVGNDLMVTLGGWPPESIDAVGGQQAAESSTFMHELGHNLGLHHGGDEEANCKPNYLSVMNYALSFPYLDPPGHWTTRTRSCRSCSRTTCLSPTASVALPDGSPSTGWTESLGAHRPMAPSTGTTAASRSMWACRPTSAGSIRPSVAVRTRAASGATTTGPMSSTASRTRRTSPAGCTSPTTPTPTSRANRPFRRRSPWTSTGTASRTPTIPARPTRTTRRTWTATGPGTRATSRTWWPSTSSRGTRRTRSTPRRTAPSRWPSCRRHTSMLRRGWTGHP